MYLGTESEKGNFQKTKDRKQVYGVRSETSLGDIPIVVGGGIEFSHIKDFKYPEKVKYILKTGYYDKDRLDVEYKWESAKWVYNGVDETIIEKLDEDTTRQYINVEYKI
jgi:hypothetical protein